MVARADGATNPPHGRSQLKALDLDEATLDRAAGIIADAITNDGVLSRRELGERLALEGVDVQGLGLVHGAPRGVGGTHL